MSRSLLDMHRSLIEESMRPFPGRPPLAARSVMAPVVPQSEWHSTEEAGGRWLVKRFTFRDNVERNRFVTAVLAFEESMGKCATLTLDDMGVHIRLSLDSAGAPMSEDQAYTIYADDSYRDIAMDRLCQP